MRSHEMIKNILENLKIKYGNVGNDIFIFAYTKGDIRVYCTLRNLSGFISLSSSIDVESSIYENLIHECNDHNNKYITPKMYISEDYKIYAECNILSFEGMPIDILTDKIHEFIILSLQIIFHVAENKTLKNL